MRSTHICGRPGEIEGELQKVAAFCEALMLRGWSVHLDVNLRVYPDERFPAAAEARRERDPESSPNVDR